MDVCELSSALGNGEEIDVETAIVASLLLLIFAHGKLVDALAAFLLGSVLGAEVDFTAFLVRRYFGSAAFSRLYGIAFSVFSLALGIGPLVLGVSFDHMGGYTPGLLLFVALSLSAALTTFAMPPYNGQADPNEYPEHGVILARR